MGGAYWAINKITMGTNWICEFTFTRFIFSFFVALVESRRDNPETTSFITGGDGRFILI